MPARTTDPDVRTRLLEAAAQILGTRGPEALTLRAVATAADTSTMAVYTQFGSMPALVLAAVAEAHHRLAARLHDIPDTDDPLRDLIRVGIAYLENARANPLLYAVMTGASPLGKYRLSTADEEQARRGTHGVLVGAVGRAMNSGALTPGSPELFAAQLLTAMHGYILFEARGAFPHSTLNFNAVLRPMMRSLCTSAGADPASFDTAVDELIAALHVDTA